MTSVKSLPGNVYELKSNVTIEDASKAGSKNKLDEVYVSVNDKNYVVQGESLQIDKSIVKKLSKGEVPKVQINLNNQKVQADVKLIDNEFTSVPETLKNSKTAKIATAVFVAGTLATITAVPKVNAAVAERLGIALGLAGGLGGTIAAGTIAFGGFGDQNSADPAKLLAFPFVTGAACGLAAYRLGEPLAKALPVIGAASAVAGAITVGALAISASENIKKNKNSSEDLDKLINK